MASKTQKEELYHSLLEDLRGYRLAWNENIESAARDALMKARAKLQIINIFGGRALADELLALFREFDEQQAANRDRELLKEDGTPDLFEPLNLAGAFDLAADRVIDGWYR